MHVDGFEVMDSRGVQYRLTTRGVGSTVKLDVIRKGKPVTVNLVLSESAEAGRQDDVRNLAGQHPLDGARVSNILPGIADEMGIDDAAGVVVLSVRDASIAARLGFKAGDVIVEIGDDKITDVASLEKAIAGRQRHVGDGGAPRRQADAPAGSGLGACRIPLRTATIGAARGPQRSWFNMPP